MDRPYLRLAPIKVQIMRQNPLAVLFVDIMSDEEARVIEQLAVPKVYYIFNFLLLVILKHYFYILSS